MPITKQQFELGIGEALWQWMERIHHFLREHKDEAFSEADLAASFAGDLRIGAAGAGRYGLFLEALQRLKFVGAIEAKVVTSTTYYAYARDLEF